MISTERDAWTATANATDPARARLVAASATSQNCPY
jgi:hypothetical protein